MPSLDNKRRGAAAVMAACIIDLFPNSQLVDCGALEYGFFVDFISKETLDEKFSQLLEERLNQIKREGRLIESKTMMRENAAEYFFHKKQQRLAKKCLESIHNVLALVDVQGAAFYIPCNEPHISSTKELPYFKLQELTVVEGIVRVMALAFESSDTLKKQVRLYEEAKKWRGDLLGEKMQLFQGKILLPKGVVFKNLILNIVRQEYAAGGFQECEATLEEQKKLARLGRVVSFAGPYLDSATLFSKMEDGVNSSLQFILKILKLFTFECVVQGRTISLVDRLGRKKEVCTLCVVDGAVQFTACGKQDFFFKQLLEHFQGRLPLCLSPEQVRILPVAARQKSAAEKVRATLEQRGFRVTVDGQELPLSARMHAAQTEKIPYTLVIGDEELKQEGTVSIRTLDQQESYRMQMDAFLTQMENRKFNFEN